MWETSSALFSKHQGNRKITRPSREVAERGWEPAEPQTHECVNEDPSTLSREFLPVPATAAAAKAKAEKTSDSGLSEQQKDLS